jgi:hypothetical protein
VPVRAERAALVRGADPGQRAHQRIVVLVRARQPVVLVLVQLGQDRPSSELLLAGGGGRGGGVVDALSEKDAVGAAWLGEM